MSKPSVPTLAELLDERRISLDALAVLSQIDSATAYRIRSGQARPRPTTIIRLADALGIGARRMQQICQATWNAAHSEEALPR